MGINRLLGCTLAAVFISIPAARSALNVTAISAFVAPSGMDTGNCQDPAHPCGTLQYAADQSPMGSFTSIALAPGDYHGLTAPGTSMLNVYEFKRVSLAGDCANPEAVRLIAESPGAPILWAQDHATLIVGCLAIGSNVSGATALSSRQFAIVDFYKIHFGSVGFRPMSVDVAISDSSIMSCTGAIWVDGPAVVLINFSTTAF